ncbi:hypothetical protein N9J89_01345 [Bacteroidia bacterium]|jgi:hypothetical protein|nr:hypothetical protein [Bacteroidia bacterium]MDB4174494.1 hypothetical protein [Bacteroidia bacterium]
MDSKVCLHCNSPIQGRADKKFCDNQCRNDYNNTQNGKSNNYIRKVNRIIKKNRNILEELCPKDKSIKVRRQELSKVGFSFEYFTNTYTTKADKTYFFCYEYGYLDLGNDYFALVYNNKVLAE